MEIQPLPRPEFCEGPVTLRGPVKRDVSDRIEIGRDPAFVRLVSGDDREVTPMTESDAWQWFCQVESEPYHWVIETDGRAIGKARLHQVNEVRRNALFAVGIFSSASWGLGHGTIATKLVLSYGFDVLRLHRIALRVLADNQRAIRCYEKCGFVREGVHREVEFVGGRWLSDLWMSVLEEEYRRGPFTSGTSNPGNVP